MVSVATRPEHVTTIVGHRPEIMCHGVTQANELESLCARASVIVLGPGLGQDMWAQDLWHYVTQLDIPMVVDADGLDLLSRNPCQKTQWVLTPHPGEAARLLGVEVADIQNDRFTAAQQLQQLFCGTVVLKGAGSIVSAAQEPTYVCYAGNPGMAAAGMGDLLTGIIAAFIAQGLPITRATYLATMVHAKAGDLAALKYGERGLLASELLPFTRQIINNKVKQDDYDEE